VRRLQEYERYKRAASELDLLERLERDVWQASVELRDRPPPRTLPQVTLRDMLLAFRDVATRAQMFAHHHVQRERLSVRERMSSVLSALAGGGFVEFARLFSPDEGRMGVTVTFMALLELLREGLVDIVQTAPLEPLHVRRASAAGTAEAAGEGGGGGEAFRRADEALLAAAVLEAANDDPDDGDEVQEQPQP
jgi:segregation and condensation protein A